MKIATDIGGTFTDLVAFDVVRGELLVAKASSTPPDFAAGIHAAIDRSGLPLTAIETFLHGSTVVINAITERKGARTALVTTHGFRDVLGIGRATRPALYDLRFRKQAPFIPRALRFEVRERVDFEGNVIEPLDEPSVLDVAERLRTHAVEAVGICFLHAYANPTHERHCAELLREHLPGVAISTSSAISQEWREYERSNTVALNAYVQPVAAGYLHDLDAQLRERGFQGDVRIMKSGGGTATLEEAAAQPIHLVESGPVGGVIGANAVGKALNLSNL